VGLRVARPRLLKVRADAIAQRRGLADVEDLLLAVPVDVDPRPVRHPGDLLVEVHQSRLLGGAYLICCLRKAFKRSRSSAACSKSRRLAASFMRVSSSAMRAWSAAGDSNVSALDSSTGTV